MIFTELLKEQDLLSLELCAWLSDSGRWRLGVRRVLFGWRVFCDLRGETHYCLDYCCGADLLTVHLILLLVARSLYSVGEPVCSRDLTRLFPTETVKPVFPKDKDCYIKLLEMSQAPPADFRLPGPATSSVLITGAAKTAELLRSGAYV